MVTNRFLRDLGRTIFPTYHAESYGFIPDDWQRELLESADRRVIVCCGRQVGKSKTTAMLARHMAETRAGSLTLILGPAERQSIEFHRKTVEDNPVSKDAEVIKKTANNKKAQELANGSRVIALPAKEETIRSYSNVDLLILDEAAYMTDGVFLAVKPMVMVGRGRIILLSTPRAKEGFFYDTWEESQRPGSQWKSIHITTAECPRVSAEDIEEARRTYPAYAFRREYLAEFTDHEDSLFSSDDLDAMFSGATKQPLIAEGVPVTAATEPLFEQEAAWIP